MLRKIIIEAITIPIYGRKININSVVNVNRTFYLYSIGNICIYVSSSNLTHIDYQRIMFTWDKYGRFKLLFYK